MMRQFRYRHVGFRRGHDESAILNTLFGLLCLAVAVLAVILPLYLFSSLNPSQETNPVVSFDATLSIVVSAINDVGIPETKGVFPLWSTNQVMSLHICRYI